MSNVRPFEPARAVSGAPAAASGESDFRHLFNENFSYVFHTLRRLGIPTRDLPDVTHDVFLQVYRRRDEYDPARPVRAWLFAFAFRMASRYRRRSSHRRELLEVAPDLPDPSPGAVERLLHDQAVGLALEVLETLELTRRAVFIMHELDGYSIPEVATALGIPVNTAYSRLRLARDDFQKAAKRVRLRRGEP